MSEISVGLVAMPGFLEYTALDALTTLGVWRSLHPMPLKLRRRQGARRKAAARRKWLRQHTKDIGKARFAYALWAELDRIGLPRDIPKDTYDIVEGGTEFRIYSPLIIFDENPHSIRSPLHMMTMTTKERRT